MKKILILCTGNSCRSQMAEAFFRTYAHDRIEARSAGLEPGTVHPLTVSVMAEAGIDIGYQRSKSVREYLAKERFDYVLFVCEKAEKSCPSIFPFAFRKLSWPFEDPGAVEGTEEERLAAFRRVRDQISARIRAWLELECPADESSSFAQAEG